MQAPCAKPNTAAGTCNLPAALQDAPSLVILLYIKPAAAAPQVRVALNVSAPLFKSALSPGDLGQLDFIQGMLAAAIKDMLVEPRRIAVSLDTEIRVEEVGWSVGLGCSS